MLDMRSAALGMSAGFAAGWLGETGFRLSGGEAKERQLSSKCALGSDCGSGGGAANDLAQRFCCCMLSGGFLSKPCSTGIHIGYPA